MATTTFYPDHDPESTSVDGWVRRVTAGTSWNDLRTGAGTGASDTATQTSLLFIDCGAAEDTYTEHRRSIFLIDTSSLTGATVLSATFSIYGTNKSSDYEMDLQANVYSSNPLLDTELAATDYDISDFGTTAFCDTSIK